MQRERSGGGSETRFLVLHEPKAAGCKVLFRGLARKTGFLGPLVSGYKELLFPLHKPFNAVEISFAHLVTQLYHFISVEFHTPIIQRICQSSNAPKSAGGISIGSESIQSRPCERRWCLI